MRKLYGVIVAALLVAIAPLTVLGSHVLPDRMEPQSSESNQASYWEQEGWTCTKINEAAETAFVMPSAPNGQTWVLLVVKQGTTNFIYSNPVAGHSYPSIGKNAPGYSHLIVCSTQTTTTTEDSTTTSTTSQETTTTAPSTTSSSEGSTTSTSTIESTTTSNPTTTSSEGSTTSSSVIETFSTSSPDPTLPFTGVEDGLWRLALALVGGGGLLLILTALSGLERPYQSRK